MTRGRRGAGVLAVVAALLAGCQAGPVAVTGAGDPTVLRPCLPTAGADPATAGVASPGRGSALPALRLACLSSAAPVRLSDLPVPAVVNLWASWCPPCRAELPAIRRYAARAGDRVSVIGVDTGDTRAAGRSTVADAGIPYPNLFDPDRLLLTAVGRTALPVTLLVDGGGRIRYVYNAGEPLTEQRLARLVADHLGIAA